MSKSEKKGFVPALRFPEFRGAGEWAIYQLGQCLSRHPEYGINAPAVPYSNNLPRYLRITDISENGEIRQDQKVSVAKCVTDENYLDEGDVVLARTGASVGKAYKYRLKDGKLVFAGFLIRVKPDTRKLNSELLFQFLSTEQYWHWVNLTSARSGQPGINGNEYSLLPIPLPPILNEQHKIANFLITVDELITAQTQKLAALKTHKKGLMQQLFPRDGETVPKLRFPEFWENGDWESKPLDKVCTVLQGYGFPEVLQGKHEGKYPFCKVSDISRAVVEHGGLLAEANNYVSDDELLKLRAKLIPKGATVFAKIGEALRLNRRAYVQNACLIDNNATGLKAIDGVAVDYFVYLLSQLIDLNKHCGGAVPSVNKSTLEKIEVVVPGPDEQKRIADFLASIDDLITAQAQKLAALKSHKKGLMQKLFPAMGEVSA